MNVTQAIEQRQSVRAFPWMTTPAFAASSSRDLGDRSDNDFIRQ
jgi:hypothetical protein